MSTTATAVNPKSSYLDQMAALLKTPSFEYSIPWMYRDTRGNVTVGVGKMLPSLAAAQALPFCIVAPDEPATAEEIAQDWDRLMGMPFGQQYGAHYYRVGTSCFLTDAEITAQLMQVLSTCDAELTLLFPNYALVPDAAKMALVDMCYNLGAGKLRDGYPHFGAAVRAQDWTTAANECDRLGISDGRNEWTKRQFLMCAA